ncbi:hypothetical protein Tco_0313202 [Tanacetum coccineum]
MNFEINLPKWVSSYNLVQSSNDDRTVVVSDEILPVYESSIINEEVENANLEHADFDSLKLPSTRASILKQIWFSSSFNQHSSDNLYEYKTDEMLENMDLETTLSVDEDSEADYYFQKQHNFDSLPFATASSYPNSDEESEKDDKVVEVQEPPSESLIQNPIIISSEMNILTENDDKVADENQEQPVG